MGEWYRDEDVKDRLRSYPLLRSQATLDLIEKMMAHPKMTQNYDGQPRGTNIIDSVGNFVLRQFEETESMRKAREIETILDALTQEQQDLTRLYYFERWCSYEVAIKMHISQRKFFMIRRTALDAFASLVK